ncbi:MAG: TetR/AcrR family transcriptional regulator [Terracidiphilus sp.]
MVRTRSLEAHDKVLRAAIDLFGARGIEATSMDAIARSSGVSKATIYNHWADKEALLLEIMVFLNGLNREPDDVDTGDLVRDLAIVLGRKPPGEFDRERDRMTPAFIAYSATHTEFGKAWRYRVTEPPRQSLKRILKRGIDRGLLPASLDLDVSMALLLGPMLYQHIFYTRVGLPSRDLGPAVAEAFCRAFISSGKLHTKPGKTPA